MKAFILIVTMWTIPDHPTVEMQRFDSRSACMSAVKSVTSRCTDINIDGGIHEFCYNLQNIEAKCVRAK